VLAPFLDTFFKKFSFKVTFPLCMVLILLFSADLVYSFGHPNTGKDITDYSSRVIYEKSSQVAEKKYIKNDFPDHYQVT
jgi:hypothetical protein